MELVLVASFSDPSLAKIAEMRLEDEGIEVDVVEGWGRHAGETRLSVWGEDYDRALEIVGSISQGGGPRIVRFYSAYLRWLLLGPAVFCSFIAARAVFTLLLPEVAESVELEFLLVGPIAASLAAYVASPRYKWVLALIVLAICLRVAWSM